MPNRIFVMTAQIQGSRKTKGSKLSCQTCNGAIKIGDVVVTNIGSKQGGRPIRHESCARRVGILD